MKNISGRPVVVPRTQIDNRLSQAAAKIDIVKGADGRRDRKARNCDAEPFSSETDLLQSLGQIAARVRKQRTSCNLTLTLGLAHGVALSDCAEVIVETSRDGFAERKLARERQLRRARSASGERPLDLNCWVDRVYAGSRTCNGSLHCCHRPALSRAPGKGERSCLRALRLGRMRLNEQGTQAKDRGNFDDPANWYTANNARQRCRAAEDGGQSKHTSLARSAAATRPSHSSQRKVSLYCADCVSQSDPKLPMF